MPNQNERKTWATSRSVRTLTHSYRVNVASLVSISGLDISQVCIVCHRCQWLIGARIIRSLSLVVVFCCVFFIDLRMTYGDEELLVSRPPLSQKRRPYEKRELLSRSSSSPHVRIECQVEERHFVDSTPFVMNSLSKPMRFTTPDTLQPGQLDRKSVV